MGTCTTNERVRIISISLSPTENEWPVAASEGKLIDKQSEKLKRMFNIKINVFIVESMFTDAQSPSANINNVEKILL